MPVPTTFLGTNGQPVSASEAASIDAALAKESSLAKYLQFVVNGSPQFEQSLETYTSTVTGKTYATYEAALRDFVQLPLPINANAAATATVPSLQGDFLFARGYQAIDSLFPASEAFVPVVSSVEKQINANYTSLGRSAPYPNPASGPSPYAGDLTLSFSQIYTLSGGDITLLVPGGLINVGSRSPRRSRSGALRRRRSASSPRARATSTSTRRAT